jgi:hypothetical protein
MDEYRYRRETNHLAFAHAPKRDWKWTPRAEMLGRVLFWSLFTALFVIVAYIETH